MVQGRANPTLYWLSRAGVLVYNNPAETAVLAYAVRYAPAKMGLVSIEVGRYTARTMPARLALGRNVGTIVLGTRGLAVARTIGLVGIYGAAAAVGVGAGIVVGTALSRSLFGVEGKDLALDFYTGTGTSWYDYIPQYNAAKIVKHWVVG